MTTKKQDVISVIEEIRVDLAEHIWVATEDPRFDIHKLYEFPDKRLRELQDRISELWSDNND